MTSRSSLQSVSIPYLSTYQSPFPTGPVEVQADSNLPLNWVNSVQFGDNVPNWRQVMRDGGDATTSLTGETSTARLENGLASVIYHNIITNQTWKYEASGSCGISTTLPTIDPSGIESNEAEAEALAKFNRRILGVNTALEGGVFLGELGQTLRTIRNPARVLRREVDLWRTKAKLIRARRWNPVPRYNRNAASQRLAEAWLDTTFGWKPLLNDIDGGCRALAEFNTGQALATSRVSAKSSKDVSQTQSTFSVGLIGQKCRVVQVGTYSVIYKGAVRVNPRNRAEMLPELLGFNPAAWVPTAWELVPYSFLIDYFVNIGDILDGWSAVFSQLSWACRSVRRESKLTSVSLEPNYGLTPHPLVSERVTHVPSKFVSTRRKVARVKMDSTFVPPLDFRIPGFGSQKWLNIAALILARGSDRSWSFGD